MVPKFEGMCTKDLKGKVMTFPEKKASMSAQFIKFEAAVYNAAGKASSSLSREIDIKRPLVLRDSSLMWSMTQWTTSHTMMKGMK